MEVSDTQRNWAEYEATLFREGYLDSQFTQLQQLQDESNPDFVKEVVSLFFEDSERILHDLSSALSQQVMDFKKVDACVHQLKGSSSSIGAQRVKNACLEFRRYYEEQNVNSCRACLKRLEEEYCSVKAKLQILLRMEDGNFPAGVSINSMG